MIKRHNCLHILYKMNSIQIRFTAFTLCVATRASFAYIAKTTSADILKKMGYVALIPASTMFYIYITGSRKEGPEVLGGKLWWNNLRPIHALCYYLFGFSAINGYSTVAWQFLALDVTIGLSGFLINHFVEGNFSKLFNF